MRRRELNQDGMVSIVVTMMIMVVVSLIVISFAKASRREQRQALDRQLNTQAFYAAESGVNDALRLLKADPTIEKKGCDDPSNKFPNSTLNATTTADASVGYSCVLVDPYPISLQYDSVGTDGSKVIPVQAANGAAISKIRINWQAKEGENDSSTCPSGSSTSPLPANASWPTKCPGMLRVDVVPLAGTFNRDQLTNSTMTSYLLPKSSLGPAPPPTCTTEPNEPQYTDSLNAQQNWDNWAQYDQNMVTWNTQNTEYQAYQALPEFSFNPFVMTRAWYRTLHIVQYWQTGGAPPNPGAQPAQPNSGPRPIGPRPQPEQPTRQNCVTNPAPTSSVAYDNTGGASDNTGFPNQGQIIPVLCTGSNSPYQCTVDITFSTPVTQYVLRLRSMYRASIVNLTAFDNSSPDKLPIKGAQAVIDVTGRANDVLRRISVRAPVSEIGNSVFPDYSVLSADTLCKRFGVAPGQDPVVDVPSADAEACKVSDLTP